MIAFLVLVANVTCASPSGRAHFRESANARLQAQTNRTGARDSAMALVTSRALAEQLGRLFLSVNETRGRDVDDPALHRVVSAAIFWLESLSFDKGLIGNELTVRRISELLVNLLDEALAGGTSTDVSAATRAWAPHVFRHGPRVSRMIRQIDSSFQKFSSFESSDLIDLIFERIADRIERGCERAAISPPPAGIKKPFPR